MENEKTPRGYARIEIQKIDGRMVGGFALPNNNNIVPNHYPEEGTGWRKEIGAYEGGCNLLFYPVIIPFSSIEHLNLQVGDMFDCEISQEPKGNVTVINLERVVLSEKDRERNKRLRESREAFRGMKSRKSSQRGHN